MTETVNEQRHRGLKQVFAVSIGLFLVFLDSTVVNIAIPNIIDDYKIDLSKASWIINGFVLTLAVLLVTLGKMADMLGRVRTFLWGVIIFAVSSFLCGIAPTVDSLIIFRILQGIGGAMVIPTSMTLVRTAVPPEKMGLAMGIWGAVGAMAVAIGPSLGGLITEYIHWRWVFYINVPIVLLAFPFIYLAIRVQNEPIHKFKLDPLGILLMSLSLFFLTYAILQGEEIGWTSYKIVLYFLISVMSGALFLFVETKVKKPILDFSIFRNRLYVSGLVSNFLGGILLMGTLILLPIFLIRVKEFSTLEASFAITPLSGVMLIVAPIIGRVIDKIGYLIPMVIGYIISVMGLILLINIDTDISVLHMVSFLAILGTGLGIIMITSVTVCTAAVSQTQISLSSGIFAMVRNMGGAVGVALFVSLTLSFLNHYSANVVDEGVMIVKKSNIPEEVKNSIQEVLMKQRDTFFEEKNNDKLLKLDKGSTQLLAKNIEKEMLAKIPNGTPMSPEMQKKIEEQVKQQLINIDKNIANIKKQIEDISKEYVAKSMAKAFFSGIILCFLSSLSLPFLSKKFSLSHSREVDI
ncbi:DHA2 family efflux MFS transporter permease subunit [Geobacillus sp. FSL W8-0032]|uniref:MFS transporter n=1 Tax=Geobacillus subterraneus TaxID=129338 RepID=A0A679FPF0_9BACL|nr:MULTISPECIES: DHA2 family efflux MFS transporter permease subunit [Geobacillus]KYD26328.1 hypothetical protein B4113_1106 [Geobacillus sp. B4113_201601]BBW98358.1 MFS transporter [Geobacillus subterraneus]